MRRDFDLYPQMSAQDIEAALGFCVKQIYTVLPEFTDLFQNSHSENYFYQLVDNSKWTNAFWTGEIWLAIS